MAPAEDDISIEEKRMFAGQAGRTDAYVATDMGLVRVSISGDKIGGFELVDRTPARDVAVLQHADTVDRLFVATTAGVRVAALDATDTTPVCSDLKLTSQFNPEQSISVAEWTPRVDESDSTGAIPGVTSVVQPPAVTDTGEQAVTDPVAIGIAADVIVIANADGTIVCLDPADLPFASDPIVGTAASLGRLDSPRAIDGPLIASAEGVARCVDTGGTMRIERVGLAEVSDVAGAGIPLAATATGLYWLGNGWMEARPEPATAVAADGAGHAMAVCDGTCFRRTSNSGAGWAAAGWTPAPLPIADAIPIALEYGPGLAVAITEDGTLFVDAGDGWRHRRLGLPGVAGVALYGIDAIDV